MGKRLGVQSEDGKVSVKTIPECCLYDVVK